MDGEIIIPITFFLAVAGILYVYLTTRHNERMAMIEKGADPALFQSKPKAKSFFLKIGMLMVGVSSGIVTGFLFSSGEENMEVIMPSTIFLFGGLSLVGTYFLERYLNKKDELM